MPFQLFGKKEDQLEQDEKATATYSALRTGILSLTPGDQKCRLYCSGAKCRFCMAYSGSHQTTALDGLYSTWITDNILAMSRFQEIHFTEYVMIDQLRAFKIQSVINLQESGEHAFCGNGNLKSGFSYDPELLMKNGIFHYNFPLPDFEACSATRLLDIVKVMNFALSQGKVAVHCHAGHGRTGMVIAAWMMYAQGITPNQAVAMVRSKRAKAVQSREQVETLHRFKLLIRNNGGMIIPTEKFVHISEYTKYNQKFISKQESRLYGKIPKVVYIGMQAVLGKLYKTVSFDVQMTSTDYHFSIECSKPLAENRVLDEQLLDVQLNDEAIDKIYHWYNDQVKKGLVISAIIPFFEEFDFRDIIRLLDLFFRSTFHQLTHKEEIIRIFGERVQNEKEWCPIFWFLIECTRVMPQELHFAMSKLISKWFLRSELDLAEKIREFIT